MTLLASRLSVSPRRALMLATALVTAFSLACDHMPFARPKTLRTLPHATDRYARLLVAQLSDADPLPGEQEIACELVRLIRGLGETEATLRTDAIEDSVYRTPEAKARRHAIERATRGHSFEVGGPLCDSLRAVGDREAPLKR
jgi:hypothetical protein